MIQKILNQTPKKIEELYSVNGTPQVKLYYDNYEILLSVIDIKEIKNDWNLIYKKTEKEWLLSDYKDEIND